MSYPTSFAAPTSVIFYTIGNRLPIFRITIHGKRRGFRYEGVNLLAPKLHGVFAAATSPAKDLLSVLDFEVFDLVFLIIDQFEKSA